MQSFTDISVGTILSTTLIKCGKFFPTDTLCTLIIGVRLTLATDVSLEEGYFKCGWIQHFF